LETIISVTYEDHLPGSAPAITVGAPSEFMGSKSVGWCALKDGLRSYVLSYESQGRCWDLQGEPEFGNEGLDSDGNANGEAARTQLASSGG
jgi:hypothetical protein